METRDDKIFKKYKAARNTVKREIQKEIKRDQQEIASQCKYNPKIFWKHINSKRQRKAPTDQLKSIDVDCNNILVNKDLKVYLYTNPHI